jgi:hypothetical protein
MVSIKPHFCIDTIDYVVYSFLVVLTLVVIYLQCGYFNQSHVRPLLMVLLLLLLFSGALGGSQRMREGVWLFIIIISLIW